MLKTTIWAALALALTAGTANATAATATTSANAGASAPAPLRPGPAIKVELLRDGAQVVFGQWLYRNLATNEPGRFDFLSTQRVPLATACEKDPVTGLPSLTGKSQEIGLRLAIEPKQETAKGYTVTVKLDEAVLKQIRTVESDGCRVELADTEATQVEQSVALGYGKTTEIPTGKYVLRLTVAPREGAVH
ncbi:hypothetical protein [Cupriavidus sp. TMH.W2]|uniref:hypothetical protein n=1 Tax=Cupriavidus sp. TMH.W2 TaxID=3434465 RepID=UPI003D78A461